MLAHAHVILRRYISLLWNWKTFLFNRTWFKLLLRTIALSFNFLKLVVTVQTHALCHLLDDQRIEGIIVLNPFDNIPRIMIDS